MNKYKVNIGAQAFSLTEAEAKAIDIVERQGEFHTLVDDKKYSIELLKQNGKALTLKVNNNIYQLTVADAIDQLVEQMGLNAVTEILMKDVKAPMPGLILDIMVKPGQVIKAGDPLLILEAMKMENVLKAVGDGQVKSVLLQKGAAVEKNQVILEME